MLAILATWVPIGAADELTTCTIQGILVDDELRNIEGAQAGLRGTPRLTTTTADGRFQFVSVEPGLYTAEAAKVGYTNGLASVECVARETNDDVRIQLVPFVPPQPYAATLVMKGHISCAAGYVSATNEVCAIARLGPPHANHLVVPLDAAAVTAAVYELEWSATSSQGRCLSLSFPAPEKEDGVTYTTHDRFDEAAHAIIGESPLGVTIESGGMGNPLHLGEVGARLDLYVTPGWMSQATLVDDLASECSPSLVVQQSFTLYATLFYNGATIPDGYSHLD